jgi:hypothetical protein
MKAARPDGTPAEPILLTESTLEQVLDAFLPEEAGATTATPGARTSGGDPAEDLFASETQEDERNDLPIRGTPELQRPWRTYSLPTEAESLATVEPSTNRVAPYARGRVRTWAIAAGVTIGLAAIGSIAVQQGLNRTPEPLPDDNKPAPIASPLPVPVPTARASEPATATPAIEPVDALREASREVRATAVIPPVTGAVLKGSLTPDSKPARAPEATSPPPREAVKAPPPIEAPAAPAAPIPAVSTPSKPAPERTPAPPAEPAASPIAPPAVRDAAPAPTEREAPPAPAATAMEPAVPPVSAETASIETVLSRYRQAFTALDADAARAVWPGVDARALGRAFDQLVEQQLDFETCFIAVNGARATAGCGGRARYVPKVGSRSVRDEPRQWTFNLQKVNGQWVIERVASR